MMSSYISCFINILSISVSFFLGGGIAGLKSHDTFVLPPLAKIFVDFGAGVLEGFAQVTHALKIRQEMVKASYALKIKKKVWSRQCVLYTTFRL